MEYQFKHDPGSGLASATFSIEHQVLGPWLEIELNTNAAKMAEVLNAIDEIVNAKTQQITIAGHEYTLVLDAEDATVKNNYMMNGGLDELPEELVEDCQNFEQSNSSQCGLEDFRQVLVAWSRFIQ